jgi:hypothetical protein
LFFSYDISRVAYWWPTSLRHRNIYEWIIHLIFKFKLPNTASIVEIYQHCLGSSYSTQEFLVIVTVGFFVNVFQKKTMQLFDLLNFNIKIWMQIIINYTQYNELVFIYEFLTLVLVFNCIFIIVSLILIVCNHKMLFNETFQCHLL